MLLKEESLHVTSFGSFQGDANLDCTGTHDAGPKMTTIDANSDTSGGIFLPRGCFPAAIWFNFGLFTNGICVVNSAGKPVKPKMDRCCAKAAAYRWHKRAGYLEVRVGYYLLTRHGEHRYVRYVALTCLLTYTCRSYNCCKCALHW